MPPSLRQKFLCLLRLFRWNLRIKFRLFIFLGSAESTSVAESLTGSLIQINCVVLTHHIVYERNGRQKIALVDVLECLLSLNFIPVGMKMALLSEQQADDCMNLMTSKSKTRHKLVIVFRIKALKSEKT